MEASAHTEVLRAGDLEIRPSEYLVLAAGKRIDLTSREFALLVCMARRLGRIVGRDELFAVVWGRDYRAGDRSVDVYVAKLREKLESALPRCSYIHTHFGFGYRFSPEPLQPIHIPATGP